MNEQLNALKPLLKKGEYDKAAELLKAYRAKFPEDWDGRLMEGIIARLRGDDETFHRIHDEAQAVINNRGAASAQIQASPLWGKYHSSWKKAMERIVIALALAGAVGAVGGSGLFMLNRSVRARVMWIMDCITYGKKSADDKYRQRTNPPIIDSLYDGPDYPDYNGPLE